jgi:hypothetical protein
MDIQFLNSCLWILDNFGALHDEQDIGLTVQVKGISESNQYRFVSFYYHN